MPDIEAIAAEYVAGFDRASFLCTCPTPGTVRDLDLSSAYEVQRLTVERRAATGERVAGYKVGCTSRAIQTQFGLDHPVRGVLLHPRVHDDGVVLSARSFIDLAVEPELVLRIGGAVDPEADDETLLAAIDAVGVGIELHNYRFFHGTPTTQELVASNAIHAGLVVGSGMAPFHGSGDDLDLEGLGLWVNGELRASGIGAEILGGPLTSLRWLARHLASFDLALRPGQLVIPGSPVGLVRLEAGDEVVVRSRAFGSAVATFR